MLIDITSLIPPDFLGMGGRSENCVADWEGWNVCVCWYSICTTAGKNGE